MFNPTLETLPLEKLRALQSKALQTMLQRLQKVPFYRSKFEAEGMDPSKIKDIRELHTLPFTFKEDLRQNYPFGMFAVPGDQINRIHASSGTTGQPTVVGYTATDLKIFAEVNARSLAAAGAKPGMKLHNAYGYGLFTGGLGLHYGGELLGMAVIPVSGGMTDRQLRLLKDFQSEVICCTPSYAQTLSEEIKRRGISLQDLNLKYALLGAEPWTEAIREEVEAGLNVIATNIYGLSEIIGPGVSQEDFEEKGTGSHVWEDHFFPEIVDPETKEPLPEGKDGVLVFTTLTKQGMPLLRYWTNDICNLHYDRDSKRTHIKMSPIKGRADDMLIIRGVNLFPTQVEEILQEVPQISAHYELVITKKGPLDKVEVKVELQEEVYEKLENQDVQASDHPQEYYLNSLANLLQSKIKGSLGLNMDISLLNLGTAPRSQGGKLSRVRDERPA